MKIKRLDIIGFKSFVDKVSLDFPQGITAVVGPNGCGKSNIVDAIRWVMGEQSAKNLRGRNMDDIIFGGCESRKPLGMAEVSLVFSTEDHNVPAKYLTFSEVTVTRRLYRDGESEYLINKTPCRLMDIAELFMDTGIGARAYSIIEQGRIGMILLSKPEERRFLIEEAAGVTKYKARKQVALKKIDLSRQNLVRIGDILSELKRQSNSLQRQAKKAERFKTYREELKDIEIDFAVADFLLLSRDKDMVAGAIANLDSVAAALFAEVETGELALEEKRLGLVEEEGSLARAQEELYRGRGEVQAAEGRLEFRRKELSDIQRQKERLTGELGTVQRQLSEADVEQKFLEERRDSLAQEMTGGEESLAAQEHRLAQMSHAERDTSRQQDQVRSQLFALVSEISQFGTQQSTAAKRLETVQDRLERNTREKIVLQEKRDVFSARSTELYTAHAGLLQQKRELTEAVSEGKSREMELKSAQELAGRELMALRDELSRKRSRLHSLEELEASFAGYGQGVKSLFQADGFRSTFPGVVADFLETDEHHEAALEAVLGEKLQYVVTPDHAAALEAVDFLKVNGGGRCTFIPCGLTVHPPHERLLGAQLLVDQVNLPEAYSDSVAALLAGTYVVEDLAMAVSLSREYPRLTFVTSEGDLAGNGGIITGGSTEGCQQGLVHKKREIKDLTKSVALESETVREKEVAKEQGKEEIGLLEEGLRAMRQKLHETDIRIINCEKDFQRAGEESRGIDELLGVKEIEDEQLREEDHGLREEMEQLLRNRAAGESRRTILEVELVKLQQDLAAQRGEIEGLREVVTGIKVRAAELKEKRESYQRGLRRLDGLCLDLRSRIIRHLAELEKLARDEVLSTKALAGEEQGLANLRQRQAGLEESCAAMRDGYGRMSTLVREEEARLKELRIKGEQTRTRLAEKKASYSDAAMKLQLLETSVTDRYRLSLSTLSLGYSAREANQSDLKARQVELQRLIEEIGEVNLTAIDEYRELEERFAFLSSQRADLEESLQSLQKAIQRINRTTRKRFIDTFHQVNAKFQEIFPRLFCGGRAELRLTNEEDLLEAGLDIIVQPPGKKLQNVALLSGGEKALTAVALVFSIFLIKPSPFCLLDEVDAPLDDANIGRFNEIVREMTTFSQFIVITHNKATMAVADTLFGVTMEEPGVSKLVSVRLN